MRRGLLRAVAALTLCLASIEAAAGEERPISLPGGELGEVLTRLALDNGIDVLFASDLVRGRRSPGAAAAQDVPAALRQVLAGTGLDYTPRGEHAFTIVPVVAPPVPAVPQQHADLRPIVVPEVTVRDRRLLPDPLASSADASGGLAEHSQLTAADLARHPDGTVADALARMAGISVAMSSIDPNLGGLDTVARGEGQFVTVRGLDSEYDVTLINGANVAQGMPYSRQVELGLMPPFGLDRIDIVKVSGADRDGDAVGGTIDFRTPTAPDAPLSRVTLRGQLDQRALDYGLDAGGGAGQLELARRFADYGIYFSAYYDRHDFVSSEQDSQNGQWGYRLATTPGLGADPPGIRREDNLVSLSANPQFTRGDIQRYGGALSFDWRGEDNRAYLRSTYGHDDTNQDVFQRGFQGFQYVAGIRQANGLYLTTTTDAQEHYWFETNPEQADLTSTIAGGESDFGRLRLSYDLFYSWGQNSRPDHLESSWGVETPPATYVAGLGGPLTLSYVGSPAYPVPALTASERAGLLDLSRFMVHNQGELNVMESDQHKAGGQVDLRADLSPDGEAYIKTGVKLTASRRFTDDRDYMVPIVAQGTLLSQSGLIQRVLPQVIPGVYDIPIPVFNGDLVHKLILSSPRQALTRDQYNQSTMWGWETVWAGYVLAHASAGPLGIEAGLRLERSDIDNHYWASGWAASTTTYDKMLPSLLMSWQSGAAGLYRAAVWTSYARPAFFQLGGGSTTEVGPGGTLTITEGNPRLKTTDATNFDLSGDWDVGSGGHVTLAGFWKALRHYMYNQGSVYLDTLSQADAATTIITPHNGGAAHIGGIEATLSQRFSFLPAPFDGLGVNLNGTLQRSVAHLDNPALSGNLPMQSAPGVLGNATLSYDRDGIEAALSYHYAGDYLEQYGLWGGIYSNGALSKWVHEARSVDLSLGCRLAPGLQVGMQVRNLLDDITYYSTIGRHNDAVPQIIEAGRVFYVTSSYEF